MSEVEHSNLTVVFTDIKGYSRMMSEDEGGALRLLEQHNAIMESVFGAHAGRIIKKLGDSYMVIFQSAEQAVKAALHALTRIQKHNKTEKPFEIRIGIHEGSMMERGGDFFGETVNIAARLEQMGTPMTVTVTERVMHTIATRTKAEARFSGACALKNIRYPVSVYSMVPSDSWKLFLTSDDVAEETADWNEIDDLQNSDAAWQRVDELIQDGDLQRSTELFESVLNRFGGSYAQYSALAALYLIAEQPSEARSALRMGEMLGEDAEHREPFAWLQDLFGEGDFRPGDVERWLGRARQCLDASPHRIVFEVLINRLSAGWQLNLDEISTLALQHPESAFVLRAQAEAYKDCGEYDEAVRILDQAAALAPNVPAHQLRRLQWMLRDESPQSIKEEVQRLCEMFPDDPEVYRWTGSVRLLEMDPAGAMWIFQQGIETDRLAQDDVAPWTITCLWQQGQFQQALEQAHRQMKRAIRANRKPHARHFLDLATIGMQLQHWANVVEILDEYVRFDPDAVLPQALQVAARFQKKLLPWNRALDRLGELVGKSNDADSIKSSIAYDAMNAVISTPEQYHDLRTSFPTLAISDWMKTSNLQIRGLLAEAKLALRFDAIEESHRQTAVMLTHFSRRLDPCVASFWAVGGLILAQLGDLASARPHLENARRYWKNAEWEVWEIAACESLVASGLAPATGAKES